MSLIRPLRRLRRPPGARFFDRFRRNTAAEFIGGNSLALLRSGSDFFGELFASLEQARRCIYLEFYIIHDDRTGARLAATLLRAADRGVEVCLLYDYIGCFDTPASYFKTLEKGGVQCVPFNPPPFRHGIAWFDRRDHRKIAIIDNRVAFAGGMNIGDEYAGMGPSLNWRDMGVRIEGGAVASLHALFRESWQGETPLLLAESRPGDFTTAFGEDDVAIVSGSPHHNRSRIRAAFRMAMAAANESILIQTPYFVPGPRFIRAMLRAVRGGVRVILILPARSDVPLVRLVNRSSYATLIRGGIELYERQGTILHAKTMLIDGHWSVIGSANLDQRSFHRNYEVNVIVASHDFGRQVGEMFAEDLSCSRRISLEEHERRGVMVRLMERLVAPVSWFL